MNSLTRCGVVALAATAARCAVRKSRIARGRKRSTRDEEQRGSIPLFTTIALSEAITMVWIFALVVLVLAPLSTAAQDRAYCAFEIAVSSPAGAPVAGAVVALVRGNGQTFSTAASNERGIARICDTPEGLVDIEVGGHLCGAVAVRHLKAFWMQTRRVSLMYQNCSGEEFVPIGGCLLTVRTLDEQGAPLSGVLLDDPDKRSKLREQTWTSDQFGRIFRFVNYGETLKGRVEKAGYVSKSVTDECQRGESSEKELVITLNRQ